MKVSQLKDVYEIEYLKNQHSKGVISKPKRETVPPIVKQPLFFHLTD